MLFTHRCPSYSRTLEYSPPQFQWSVLSSQTREMGPRAALAPWTLMWITRQQHCSEARLCVSHRSHRALGGNVGKTFWGSKCWDTPHKLGSFYTTVTQTVARMFQPVLPGPSGFFHMLLPLSRRLVPSWLLPMFLQVLETHHHLWGVFPEGPSPRAAGAHSHDRKHHSQLSHVVRNQVSRWNPVLSYRGVLGLYLLFIRGMTVRRKGLLNGNGSSRFWKEYSTINWIMDAESLKRDFANEADRERYWFRLWAILRYV